MPHAPVTFEQLRPIGHIIKTFGYEGDYIMYSNYGEAIEDLDFVFVEIDGLPVPFKLSGTTFHKGEMWRSRLIPVIDDQDLTGHTIYATSQDLIDSLHHDATDPDSKEFFIEDLIGFDIIDTESDKVLGRIIGIEDSTANNLFIVSRAEDNDSKMYIPIADEFIEYIDEGSIGVTLPKGLLEL